MESGRSTFYINDCPEVLPRLSLSLTEDEIIERVDNGSSSDISEAFSYLPARTCEVIKMHFGFYDGEEKSSEEIAVMLNLTPDRVAEIFKKGLSQMKEFFANQRRALVRRSLHGVGEEDIEKLPPTTADIEKVYLYVPDAQDGVLVRSLEPSSFSSGKSPFTTREKQWLYALAFASKRQPELKKHLAEKIFRCHVSRIAVHFALSTSSNLLRYCDLDNDAWNDLVHAGLEEKALERLPAMKEERSRLRKRESQRRAVLDLAYSYVPDNRDADFVRRYEHRSFVSDDCDWGHWQWRWIYTLFLFGPKDEEGKQELIRHLANNVFNRTASEIAELAECASEEGRDKYGKKYNCRVEYGYSIPEEIEKACKRKKKAEN